MNKLEDRLRELLSRGIFFSLETKKQIMAADPLAQKEILDILEKMDVKQTRLFKKVLEQRPYFFEELEQKAKSN